MPPRAKTIFTWIVVIIVLYNVVRYPDRAASAARSVWDFIYATFAGFGTFLSSLAA